MRVWDVDPSLLCRPHLLGEHAEAHGIHAVIARGTRGYAAHPEVRRWRGKLPALKRRHDALVGELERRGYRHRTPMSAGRGRARQDVLLATIPEQLALLAAKGCLCPASATPTAVGGSSMAKPDPSPPRRRAARGGTTR